MLPYIFFTFTVGISLLVAEFAMGRAGREGPMASLTKVCGRGWGFFGGVGVFTVFLILSFYSGVGGWCIKYGRRRHRPRPHQRSRTPRHALRRLRLLTVR